MRITGVMYTARDAAHARLLPLIDAGQPLPIDVRGQIIYYTGPSPARPGDVVGSIGPTTGGRMDKFTPKLLALGLKGTLGKGARSQLVKDALRAAQGRLLRGHRRRGRGALGLREEARDRGLRGPRHRGHPAPRGGRVPRHRGQRLPRRRSLSGRHEGLREGERMNGATARQGGRILGQARPPIAAAHLRTDPWWALPLTVVVVLLSFIVYSTWAAFQNAHYFADPYLSPFYSPCLDQACLHHSFGGWALPDITLPIIGVLSPAFLILGGPGPLPPDLLLLPQGVLPLVLAGPAGVRGARTPSRATPARRASR